MHELVHLDFISTQVHKRAFVKSLGPTLKKLERMGISEESLAKYASDLFDGLNRQIFNTPIDLFIEEFLYNEYPDLQMVLPKK